MNRFYVLFLLILLMTRPLQGQQIAFEKGTWKEVLARAKSQNKIVFVDVYTTWCGPCKMLDQQVFVDKAVAATYNAYFINYKADAERGEGVHLARQYGVRAYPTALFIDGDGQLIDTWIGFKPAYTFKQEGERVFRKTPVGMTLSLYDATYKEGNREYAFMRNYLRIRRHAGQPSTDLLNDYVAHLPADSLRTPSVTSLLIEHTAACQGPAFEALLSRKDEIHVRARLETLLINELNAAGLQRSRSRFDAVCRAVERLEPADRVAERLAEYQLMYLAVAEDWKAYAEQGNGYAAQYLMPNLTADRKQQQPAQFQKCHDQLCNIGYFISQHDKDDARLSAALGYFAAINELAPTPLSTSLQACLRYRLGERDEAVALQSKALELARAKGDNVTSYEATLHRMQKKKSL